MSWYKKYLSVYEKPFDEVPEEVVAHIRKRMKQINACKNPQASVVVIAHNEESRITSCLWSLCNNLWDEEYEIIVVNNLSTDHTTHVLEALNAVWYDEQQKGPGFARNCGLKHARGKYHLCIDADSIYPPTYISATMNELEKKDTVCTYSLWSFIPAKGYPRWQLSIYEALRDVYLFIQNYKRPELCVRGMTFSFRTDIGQQTGFRTDILRGEDGSMALAMKPYGKLKLITNRKCRIYTGLGTLKNDGSFLNSFKVRLTKALKNIGGLFTKKETYEDKEDNLIKN